MRAIARLAVDPGTQVVLTRRQTKVNAAPNPVDVARSSWNTFSGNARQNVLDTLRSMSRGLERCMYCEDSMGTDIDHFEPKHLFPGSAFLWTNYLLACSYCNSNQKRGESPFDVSGNRILLDPTVDDPLQHLAYSPSTGRYVGLTTMGSESIRIFGLNRQVCTRGRQAAWVVLTELAVSYDRQPIRRPVLLETVRTQAFQAVRVYMRAIFNAPGAARTFTPSVMTALGSHPILLH